MWEDPAITGTATMIAVTVCTVGQRATTVMTVRNAAAPRSSGGMTARYARSNAAATNANKIICRAAINGRAPGILYLGLFAVWFPFPAWPARFSMDQPPEVLSALAKRSTSHE